MASFHCSVKSGAAGSGGAHAEYIEREEKYAKKKDDDLEAVITDNLPEWAANGRDFFHAADEFERANGSSYREYEIALPRELTKEQRAELVREFIAQEIGAKHAYTAAIHNPRAAIEGGEQPHAHIMFSERTRDGIDRPREQYFKRFNAKNPEKGGAQKANKPATPTERKAELVKLRERFAELQNKHLAKAGHQVRVTHLSLRDQGIDRLAEVRVPIRDVRPLASALRADRQERQQSQTRDMPPQRTPEPVKTEPERPKIDVQAILAASLARQGDRVAQAAAAQRAAEAQRAAQARAQELARQLEAQKAEQARQERVKAAQEALIERRKHEPPRDEPKHSGPSR